MAKSTDKVIMNIIEQYSNLDYIGSDEIPDLELYMDQVTSFMDRHLSGNKRREEDKTLTKAMINNYAKSKVLPAPNKKKYSKDHIIMLIFIYYMKNFLSINDIKKLLTPVSEKYFGAGDAFNLVDLYEELFEIEHTEILSMKESLFAGLTQSREAFADAPAEDREYLQLLSFICTLSMDIYVKQKLIERLIDQAL